jgi:hypothetical protein
MSQTPHPVAVVEDQDHDVDLPSVFSELVSQQILDESGNPQPVIAGTMALYPDGRGGLVIVADVADGGIMPAGVHRARLPAGMVRALGVLASGGGKMAALRALGGRRGRG